MRKVNRFFFVLATGVLLWSGCSSSSTSSSGSSSSGDDELVVWTFTDELGTIVEDYYLADNTDLDYDIKVVSIPTDQFETKLDPVLGTDNAPDVVALESAFVKKYVESGMLANLEEYGLLEDAENTYDYVKDVGTAADGELKALSWQAAPGAFFYRTSLAEQYLGIKSAEEMQAAISDYDKFYETAKTLKEKSNGSMYMIASVQDLAKPFYGQREHGWVEDGKLVVDDSLTNLLEMSKKFVSEGLTLDAEGQGEAWFAGMSGNEILGYSLPTWGLHYWLKTNAESSETGESTAGDWTMVQGPTAYFWGGTWIGTTDNSNKKEEAADLISYITTNEDFLEKWATDTGDFVGNENVVNEYKADYSEEFLGGQNSYGAFADMAQNINGAILTEYDQTIETLFTDNALTPYSKGEVDIDTALKNFKEAVANAYPDVEVE